LLLLGREPTLRKTTVRLARVRPGDHVLDVGSGTGSLTIEVKRKAGPRGAVHGIDAAPEMVEVARDKATRAGVDIDFQVGLIEEIPFPDAEFDLVVSSLMLHHLPEDLKRKGFRETYRVLKPGGRFFAVDLEPPSNRLLRHLLLALIGHHAVRDSLRLLGTMMGEAGFRDVKTGKAGFAIIGFLRGKRG
jgi:demethylmenaquinone methyltransferase/2-methoxy-6-polyprenyl-1,4-benzoquinol methylase/phosphoethanolamine N-methyltransferase